MRQTDQSPPEVTPVFNTGKATRTVYDRLKGDHLWLSDKKKINDHSKNVRFYIRLSQTWGVFHEYLKCWIF